MDYIEVILHYREVKKEIKKRRDEDLINVLVSYPPSIKFDMSTDAVVKRFFATNELTLEDREFIEGCHLLVSTEHSLEE